MAIDAQHPQYVNQVNNWTMINDVVDIENLEQYLIALNKLDTSDENKARNTAYAERAVFYALTSQTVTGMLGTIFGALPVFAVPDVMDYLKKNVDGRGNSIYQQSQIVTKKNMSISRAGLFVTHPKVEGDISKADINAGIAVAKINYIEAERIINWAEETVGAITRLSLVVIKDTKSEYVDYVLKEKDTLRELYLEDGIYKERIWEKPDNSDKWTPGEEAIPVDKSGKTFAEIPFTFVGATNNDPDVDVPNMLSMSKLNIAHYRNSADFEDTVWFAGQAQPWMSNVGQDHVDMMKKNNMYVGSRMMLAVPENGQFGFESAPPNPTVRQAMLDKIDMMIGIGARMITPGGVAKTAEQSGNERETQHSSMTLIAANVSDAYVRCFKWVGLFMGADTTDSVYALNEDFIKPNATPAELKEVIVGYVAGQIPSADYIRYMKDYGIFDEEKDDEEYAEELELNGSGGGDA